VLLPLDDLLRDKDSIASACLGTVLLDSVDGADGDNWPVLKVLLLLLLLPLLLSVVCGSLLKEELELFDEIELDEIEDELLRTSSPLLLLSCC
jgi:hypothetical protein